MKEKCEGYKNSEYVQALCPETCGATECLPLADAELRAFQALYDECWDLFLLMIKRELHNCVR